MCSFWSSRLLFFFILLVSVLSSQHCRCGREASKVLCGLHRAFWWGIVVTKGAWSIITGLWLCCSLNCLHCSPPFHCFGRSCDYAARLQKNVLLLNNASAPPPHSNLSLYVCLCARIFFVCWKHTMNKLNCMHTIKKQCKSLVQVVRCHSPALYVQGLPLPALLFPVFCTAAQGFQLRGVVSKPSDSFFHLFQGCLQSTALSLQFITLRGQKKLLEGKWRVWETPSCAEWQQGQTRHYFKHILLQLWLYK